MDYAAFVGANKFAPANSSTEFFKLPLWLRKRARMNAQLRFATKAPNPVIDSMVGSGGDGRLVFCHADQIVAMLGTSSIPASNMPTNARWRSGAWSKEYQEAITRIVPVTMSFRAIPARISTTLHSDRQYRFNENRCQ